MGLLDNQALAQGLLGLGGGLLSNSTGHYGQFGPAFGAGVQGFNQNYFGAIQQQKENEFKAKQMEMLKAMQDAQIGNYKSEGEKRQAEIEKMLRDLQDANYDRGLIGGPASGIPGFTGPGNLPSLQTVPGFPSGNAPSLPAQSAIQVKPYDVGNIPSPTPMADPGKLFPINQQFPTDIAGLPKMPPSAFRAAQIQPAAPEKMPEQPQTNVQADVQMSKSFLDQANYWKDLAGKARTKEFRDQYFNNYRDAYNKYAEMVKQETTGDLWQTVEGAPGVLRQKNSNSYMLNGKPITAEQVQSIAAEQKKAGATSVVQNAETKVNAQLPASEQAQKQFMDKTASNYEQLRTAPFAIDNFRKIRELVPQAGTFVGSLADKKLDIAKFFNNNFGTNINPDSIASAQELQSRLFYQIMDNLKKMDAQPSEMQQRYMQQALGNITTDPKAIPRIIDIAEESIRQRVDLHNKEVNSAIKRGVQFPYDPIIQLNKPAEEKKIDLSGWSIKKK